MKGVDMGQATVDLPDPLAPQSPNAASTDELLAQLAGEEIDRLLAEADSELAGDAKPSSAAVSTAPAAVVSTPAAEKSPTGAASPPATLSAELDDLFAQLTVGSAADIAVPTPTTRPPAALTTVTPAAVPGTEVAASAVPTAEDQATTAAERGALSAPDIPPAPTAPQTGSQSPANGDELLPLYLRPLEWINAPLAACPEHVRDAIGKIAILTTINALSILAYLLFLRKHG